MSAERVVTGTMGTTRHTREDAGMHGLRRSVGWVVSSLLGLVMGGSVAAQQTEGWTPLTITPGAPAGAYALSGFESVNYFNGHLNFNLPLVSIGGRGGARTTLALTIDQAWSVLNPTDIGGTPVFNAWSPVKPGYGPGVLVGRTVSQGTPCSTGVIVSQSLTRFSFIAPDGSELEFRDQLHDGQPGSTICTATGYSRGTVFVTNDGSAATFTSSTTIRDLLAVHGNDVVRPTGTLMWRDGTRFQIVNALVTEIRDRNGNLMTFQYEDPGLPASPRLVRVTDSIKRIVQIEYENGSHPNEDWILFSGYANAARKLRVVHADLGDAFPPDQSYTVLQLDELFPEFTPGSIALHNPRVVRQLILPNGQGYTFEYNPYGELEQVWLPTGGRYRYTYDAGLRNAPASGFYSLGNAGIYRRVVARDVYADDTPGSLELSTVISRPEDYVGAADDHVRVVHSDVFSNLLREEWHYYHGYATDSTRVDRDAFSYPGYREGRERQTDIRSATALLMRTTHTWAQRAPVAWWPTSPPSIVELQPAKDPRLTQTVSQLWNGAATTYTTQQYSYDTYNNRTETREYDFGGLTLLRRRTSDYATTINTVNYATNPAIHIRDLPLAERTYDGAGSLKSETTYEYDNYSASANHAPLVDTQNVAQHDAGWGTGYTRRGNVTAVTRAWDHGTNVTSISSFKQYDVLGNVLASIDPNGHVTTISYTDNFGVADDDATTPTAPVPLGGQKAFAFPTWVTDPSNHSSYTQYDYYLGKPVNTRDPNAVVASLAYGDDLDRPTELILARAGGQGLSVTRVAYDDDAHVVTTTRDQTVWNDKLLVSDSRYDSFGRPNETRVYEGEPDGSPCGSPGDCYISTQNGYDGLGRPAWTSNPYRPNNGEPQLLTYTDYDALDRVVAVTTPDDAVATTSYALNVTTTTDQANKVKRTTADALGRAATVVEDPGSSPHLNYTTSYGYNVFDQVTSVAQGTQSRSFSYDNLGLMFSSTTPESGTTTYTYYPGGQLKTKTDARNATTTFGYDVLDRLTSKTYTGIATPNVTYVYDDPSPDPAVPNSIGRLVRMSSSVSATRYLAYDPLGRVLGSRQSTDSKDYPFGYTYDRVGNLKSETYPSGLVVNVTYDEAERVQQVASGTVYASGMLYAPHGALSSMSLGNSLYEHTSFNNRLQPTEIGLGTVAGLSNVFRIQYPNYGGTSNNGNVLSQTVRHTVPAGSFTWSQAYTYDGANRLKTASEQDLVTPSTVAWSQTYSYDQFGNRWVSANTGTTLSPLTPTLATDFNAANNRLAGGANAYDPAGNHKVDKQGRQFSYDAESRQVQFQDVSGPSTYVYDGDGRRVLTTSAGVTTTYVYDAHGRLAAEYAKGAPAVPAGVSYITADHLGSTRLVSGATGGILGRHDYFPWGEELPSSLNGRGPVYGSGTDKVRHKFTGKERDGESGLDYFGARYDSGAIGRFSAADPLGASGRATSPQSWNRYAYTLNNPLRYIDPSGTIELPLSVIPNCSTAAECKTAARASAKVSWGAVKQLLNIVDLSGPANLLPRLWPAPGVGADFELIPTIKPSDELEAAGALGADLGALLFSGAQLLEVGLARFGSLGALADGSSANLVYRGLAVGDEPALGLLARVPEATISPASHVAGARATQWISTTRSLEIATTRFGQNGVVAIDLTRVPGPVVDLTGGIPGLSPSTMLSRWAVRAQEVLVQGPIPPTAIRPVSSPH